VLQHIDVAEWNVETHQSSKVSESHSFPRKSWYVVRARRHCRRWTDLNDKARDDGAGSVSYREKWF
jgi:hypothetical protein